MSFSHNLTFHKRSLVQAQFAGNLIIVHGPLQIHEVLDLDMFSCFCKERRIEVDAQMEWLHASV